MLAERYALIIGLLEDPGTRVGAKVYNLKRPVSYLELVLMDHYDLTVAANTAKGTPRYYDRPIIKNSSEVKDAPISSKEQAKRDIEILKAFREKQERS